MEFDKLINKNNNGTYCILFKNVHSLNEIEIKNIFSQYGKICNISTCGEKFKLFYFIKYATYNEAQIAVTELNNHPKIKLLQHRKKNDKKQDSKDTILNDMSFQNKNKINFKHSLITNTNKNENNKYSTNKTCHENVQESNVLLKFITSQFKSENLNALCRNDSQAINKNLEHNHIDINDIPPLITSNSFKNKIPNGTVKKEKNVAENNKHIVVENAEEVIVGNIHPNFGVPYILHIFDNFEPIAISKMNVIPKIGIRYCHVYFKSIQDSVQVEKKFDGMDLLGQKLLVLSLNNLIKEAET